MIKVISVLKLVVFSLAITLVVSCQDAKKENSVPPKTESSEDKAIESPERNFSKSTKVDSTNFNKIPNSSKSTPEPESNQDYSGTYINLAHINDNDCNCYCLEIVAGSSGELCLKPGELFMEANFRKVGESIHIFFKSASVNSTQNDIPWNEIDTGTAVATFSKTGPNEFKLDWKGFQIDGKTAVDYALLGKKTLEGTYKLK